MVIEPTGSFRYSTASTMAENSVQCWKSKEEETQVKQDVEMSASVQRAGGQVVLWYLCHKLRINADI